MLLDAVDDWWFWGKKVYAVHQKDHSEATGTWVFLKGLDLKKKKIDTYVNVNPRYQVQKIMFSAK